MAAAIPEVKYASAEGVSIAYQVWGSGEQTIVITPPFVQNIELMWEHPTWRRYLDRLGQMARVVQYDKRGTGLSERTNPPHLDDRVADVEAVMDAAGVDAGVLMGISEGASVAVYVAASRPERVSSLVLVGGFATLRADHDHPGYVPDALDAVVAMLQASWGSGAGTTTFFCPSMAEEPGAQEFMARYERMSLAPSDAAEYLRVMSAVDVRGVLPSLHVPTVIVHARGDRVVPVDAGRYLADHIEGAEFVLLDSDDHVPYFGSQDEHLAVIARVLGQSTAPAPTERTLATVLLTDIAGSTRAAERLGDAGWRRVLDVHDSLARGAVERHGGRWVKSTGDGVLATFAVPSQGVRCALEIVEGMARHEVGVRAGVHCGEVEVRGDDIGGIAVHFAARLEAFAEPGTVVTSRTVRDLAAGSGLGFCELGTRQLAGLDGEHDLYVVA